MCVGCLYYRMNATEWMFILYKARACFEVNTVFPCIEMSVLNTVCLSYTWRNNELGFFWQRKGLLGLVLSPIIWLSVPPGMFTQTFPAGSEPGHALLCDLLFSLDLGPLLGWPWPLLPLAGQLSLTFPSVPKAAAVGLDVETSVWTMCSGPL